MRQREEADGVLWPLLRTVYNMFCVMFSGVFIHDCTSLWYCSVDVRRYIILIVIYCDVVRCDVTLSLYELCVLLIISVLLS